MRVFILISIFLSSYVSSIGQTLNARLDSLKFQSGMYEFVDPETKKLYTHGWMEQRYAYPVFRTVSVFEKSREIKIEGILTVNGDPKDTTGYGYCCFEILVGQLSSKGDLYNVRKFGSSLLATDSLNTSGRDGFFSLKFRGYFNDVLIIGNPGRNGAGAIAYNVGKLLK